MPLGLSNAYNSNDYKHDRIKLFWKSVAPSYDVLILVEVWQTPFDNPGHRSEFLRLGRDLFPYSCYVKQKWHQIMTDGQLIMSRYPLSNCEHEVFEATTGMQSIVPRGILSAHVTLPNQSPILLVVTHVHVGEIDSKLCNDRKSSGAIQQKQIRQLRRLLSRRGVSRGSDPDEARRKNGIPYILAGDMNICAIGQNDHGTDYSFDQMIRDLDLQRKNVLHDQGQPPTYPVPFDGLSSLINDKCYKQLMAVDHVFCDLGVNQKIQAKVEPMFVNGMYLSDHAGIELIIEM